MNDESYIVRIYRRSLQYPEGEDGIVGVVEDISHAQRTPFHTIDELIAILIHQPQGKTTKRRNKS